MTIHTLPLGFLQTNCYIVSSAESCIAIDPGADAELVLAFLEETKLRLDAVLLTHGHFDHVGAVEALAKRTGCEVWIHENDFSAPNRQFFPLADTDIPEIFFFEEGDCFDFAGLRISILETPGHTDGSVCICIGDAMFAGDTLFANSIGRTDLEGGNMQLMQRSLLRLKNLEENYTVYPGHGPKTSLEREKRVNPYLR